MAGTRSIPFTTSLGVMARYHGNAQYVKNVQVYARAICCFIVYFWKRNPPRRVLITFGSRTAYQSLRPAKNTTTTRPTGVYLYIPDQRLLVFSTLCRATNATVRQSPLTRISSLTLLQPYFPDRPSLRSSLTGHGISFYPVGLTRKRWIHRFHREVTSVVKYFQRSQFNLIAWYHTLFPLNAWYIIWDIWVQWPSEGEKKKKHTFRTRFNKTLVPFSGLRTLRKLSTKHKAFK